MEKIFEIKIVSTKKQKCIEDRGSRISFGKDVVFFVHGVFQNYTEEDGIVDGKEFRFYQERSYPFGTISALALTYRDTDEIWEVEIEFAFSSNNILAMFKSKIEAARLYNYVIDYRKASGTNSLPQPGEPAQNPSSPE